jgi:very-short-patch-repair endonuclease
MKYGTRKKSYAPKSKVSVKTRGYQPMVVPSYTLAEAFAAQGQGNTKFEKAVDGAAKSIGIRFDYYQYYVPLTSLESTIIDFVLFYPKKIAVFADGIQHELRPDTAQDDIVRRNELESDGWVVVAITERDFLINPIGQVSQILFV